MGQSIMLVKSESKSQLISIHFEQTKGIDKSVIFPDGAVGYLINPEIIVFSGCKKESAFLGRINVKRKKDFIVNTKSFIIRHNIDALNYFDYVFEKNDSIRFKYAKSIPSVVVENNIYLKYNFNFESYFRDKSSKENYFVLAKFLNPKFFIEPTKSSAAKASPELRMSNLLMKISKIQENSYTKAMALLRSENNLLDSLKERKLISEKPYQFYKDKVKNLIYILNVETNRLSRVQVQDILAASTKNPYDYPELYHQKLIEAAADKFIT